MRPDLTVVLVESRRKRVDWLKRMRGELGLTNCAIEGKRLELVEAVPVGVITARAFASLADIITQSARFSTSDSVFVLPKGRSAAQELAILPKKQRKLFHVEQSQTDPEAGIIVGKLAKGTVKTP